ncbi:helix-turn-helix transcriptional regulator [Methylosinus sporium]|uniref:Helix-turn-helix transcriptional regulator n=1 Tax=Methylosinus sporium TaxID=428 RepID=A0A549T5K9_METSR|nr:helix-turn-helix transcriptional regulator [Methylosinus sporium]TRL37171.1 helix-turn-helix transcriptional regulator [Methylosinus sporium]
MEIEEVIATNVRRLRNARKWTQEALAEKAQLSSRYVGAIERANVSARVSIIGRIADALGVEPAELLKRSKPKARS